jgi:MFS family permease
MSHGRNQCTPSINKLFIGGEMKNIKNKNKILYTLLLSQSLSLIGTRMTTVALGIWLFQKTGRATDLLLMPFFNELPALLFGHFLGVLVDRYDRKKLMILSDAGQGLGSMVLFLSIWTGSFEIWHLYGIVFFQGVFAAVQGPTADATVTLLTDETNRAKVNGFKELTFPAAGVLAPMLAGLLYVSLGIIGVLVLDGISFVVASFMVSVLRIPKPNLSEEGLSYKGHFLKEATSGYAYLKNQKNLWWLVLYFALINFLINGPLELVIPYIIKRTKSELFLTFVLSLMSGATVLGALLMIPIGKRANKLKSLYGVMVLSGMGFVAFGLVKHRIFLSMTIILVMLPLPILNALFKTILQNEIPEDMQGRVFSVVYQMAYGIAPLSFLVTGPLVDQMIEPFMLARGYMAGTGMGLTFSFTGGLLLVMTLLFKGIIKT